MSLIGLPAHYRIQVRNEAGVSLTATDATKVTAKRTKFDSAGALDEDTESTLFAQGAGDLANNAYQ